MKTFHILCLAGYGDILSHITRLPALREKYPREDYDIKFWLGGFGKAVQFSKEQLEREGCEASIIKNLTFHNQLPEMRKFIQDSLVEEGDMFEDWSFCEEIFVNKTPIFMQYPVQISYSYTTSISAVYNNDMSEALFKNKNAIAIQPLTKSGNAEGFEHDVQQNRFWTRENWIRVLERMHDDELIPVFTGIGDEDWGLREECDNKGIKYYDMMGANIVSTMEFLKVCNGCIATNSWTWEVASRHMKPTVCLYLKNHFFIQNHIPDGPSEFFDTCYIETDNEADPDRVYDTWKYMYDNQKRPEVEYSVCMITYNDEDCVRTTCNNVAAYKPEEFVVVDGGSKDSTKHHLVYLSDFYNLNLIDKLWADDFEVQKNYALDQAKHKWRLWIDADETYEHLFWNQISWYIWQAEKEDVECLWVPRINTIEGLDDNELGNYAKENGWNISGFRWINYPDSQQRLFTDQCKFVGRTHERIVGYSKERHLKGVHCIHPKTKSRQQRGLDRERKQYEIEAEKVYEKVTKDE